MYSNKTINIKFRWLQMMAFAAFIFVSTTNIVDQSFTSLSAQDRIDITVRGGEQTNFSRLVFDFPVEVPYRITIEGNILSVAFDAEFVPQYDAAVNAGLRFAKNYRMSYNAGRTIISMTVPDTAFPRHFRQAESIVLDIFDKPQPNLGRRFAVESNNRRPTINSRTRNSAPTVAQSTQTTPAPAVNRPVNKAQPGGAIKLPNAQKVDATQNANGPANNDAVSPANRQQVPGADNASITAQSQGGDTSTEPTLIPQAPQGNRITGNFISSDISAQAAIIPKERPSFKSSRDEGDKNVDPDLEVAKKSRTVDISQANTNSLLGNEKVDVSIKSLADLNGVSITFSMNQRTPAAAFQRSGFLWVVFDKSLGLANEGFQTGKKLLEGRIKSVSATTNRDALVIRMGVRANQNLVMESKDNDWILQLKDTPTRPRFPIVPNRRNDRQNGSHIFLSASEIGTKLILEDPAIGDEIVVIPLRGPGRGVAQTRNYAEASLLASAQGIAIEPLSDGVMVERYRNGVAIKSDALSKGPVTAGSSNRLIDFPAWKIGENWEFRKYKARLMMRLSLATPEEKNQVRWDLARYYLAHGRHFDTIGITKVMLETEPALEKRGEFLAVRGIARFMAGRLDLAAEDLFKPDLNAEQDAELWRAALAEAQGRNKAALNYYRRGKDVMGTYDAKERAEFQLAIIRAALEEDEIKIAGSELELLNGLNLSKTQAIEAKYLKGLLAQQHGQLDAALTLFDDLSDVAYRPISAKARYSRVKYNLARNEIDEADAIEVLERLRYAWRGDRFESKLIADLGTLYLNAQQYDEGLTVMRQGITYFPREAARAKLPVIMRDTFRGLFLDGKAENLPPLKAIGLFFKFQELTPKGADGDRLVRRLADRLVNVDLLDRAIELYEYQVSSRVEGTAKAVVAIRLAKIHILNKEPERAVGILRATRQQRLPDDVISERRWVEARALIEQTKYEEGEVLLEDDESIEAESLRADLFWGSRDWSRVVRTNKRLLGNGWRRNEPISAVERLYLIRSCIAMSFMQDKDGLSEVRDRYGLQMRTGDFANAFEHLTGQIDLSGGELGTIAAQIAGVEKLRTFMRDYRGEFAGF